MTFVHRALAAVLLAIIPPDLALAQSAPHPEVADIPVPVPAAPEIGAESWVLMDYATGRVLAAHQPDLRVEPASLTKIMTDYVVSAEVATGKVGLDDEVFISEHAWRAGGAGSDGSTSFLKVKSKVPLKALLYGMIIQSGNDSAIALAEHVAGSEETFAALMNAYAKQLGMVNTHFANASGYPAENHYSSARDIAILSRALIHDYPEDYAISAIKKFEWNGITQHNRNTLLWRDDSVDGIKTGHTSAAGYCLAASAQRGDERMIAIVMGTDSEDARADAAQALLNYGFRFYETHNLYQAGKALAEPEIWKADAETLPIGVAEDVLVTIQRGQYEALKASLDMPRTLVAPFAKGDRVGTLRINVAGEPVMERPLVALVDAPEAGIFTRLVDSVGLWFQDDDEAEAADEPAKDSP